MSGQIPTIIRGVVRGDAVVSADLELVVGDGAPRKVAVRQRFELTTDDGRKFQVDAADSSLLGTDVRINDNISELAGHPLLKPFEVKAGPHVKINVSGVAIQTGEQAVLYGQTTPQPDISAGVQNASPEGAEYFKVSIMASGPEAEKLVARAVEKEISDRARKSGDSPRLSLIRRNLWALYLLPAMALYFVSLGSFDGLRKLGIALLLTGAVFAARRRAVPMFHTLEHGGKQTEVPDSTAERWPTWDFILACYVFIVFAGVVLAAVEAAAKLKSQFSPFLALIPAVMILLYFRNRQSPNIQRLKALLKAPALPENPADGAYGSVEGKITCAAPPGSPGTVSCIWCAVPTYDADTGKAGGSIAQRSRAGKDLFFETGKDTIGLSHGQGALWASALKIERRTCGWTQLTYPGTGSSKIDTEDYIPEGSRALAAGRISKKGDQTAFTIEGTEALLLFASGRRNPRAAIRLTLAAYVLSCWLLLLAAAAPGLLGLAYRAKPKTAEKVLEATEVTPARSTVITRKNLAQSGPAIIPAASLSEAVQRIVKETAVR